MRGCAQTRIYRYSVRENTSPFCVHELLDIVCTFGIQGWKLYQNAVAVGGISVFNNLTVSTYSLSWCPEGGFGVTCWCLLVTLGAVFLIFEGLGDRLEV